MYFYLIQDDDLIEEIFATNLSEEDIEETERELIDKNGEIAILKSEKRLKYDNITKVQ